MTTVALFRLSSSPELWLLVTFSHTSTSGSYATVKSPAEMRALVADADKLLGEYKATHEGWL